ncbi:unnamed protein product [Anisakis simplex]|uniref:Serine/threonine-protein kinase DDB_G0282963 n=1 Tax=Anisakis simplex TaxID=6269 RepID=A0A0M3K6X4_ANISI|nr:unnamed protein product [Anisakis simplex]
MRLNEVNNLCHRYHTKNITVCACSSYDRCNSPTVPMSKFDFTDQPILDEELPSEIFNIRTDDINFRHLTQTSNETNNEKREVDLSINDNDDNVVVVQQETLEHLNEDSSDGVQVGEVVGKDPVIVDQDADVAFDWDYFMNNSNNRNNDDIGRRYNVNNDEQSDEDDDSGNQQRIDYNDQSVDDDGDTKESGDNISNNDKDMNSMDIITNDNYSNAINELVAATEGFPEDYSEQQFDEQLINHLKLRSSKLSQNHNSNDNNINDSNNDNNNRMQPKARETNNMHSSSPSMSCHYCFNLTPLIITILQMIIHNL